jgi:shikimate dehydrogenase
VFTSVGLIGDPVAHSLSPVMQKAAFSYHRLTEAYALWQTSHAQLQQRVEALRNPGMRGANVTLPHKTAVMSLLDVIDPVAQVIGAVNTIVRLEDGHLYGLNTDAPGFMQALQVANFGVVGQDVVVLGAGGAARAVVYGLIHAGIQSLVIVNRTLSHAETLLSDMLATTDDSPYVEVLTPNDSKVAQTISEANVVINATSVGLDGVTLPLAPEFIQPHHLVVDLIYHRTPLLYAAAERGAETQDGLEMLVQQGALAFEAWTKLPAPVDQMRTAAREALERTAA